MLNLKIVNAAMEKLALNQAAIAELCNVSREAVSNWLSGESIPRPSKVKALANALKISIKDLILVGGNFPVPIVAYRTKKNMPVTGAALVAALDQAQHLRQLVPYISDINLFIPAHLESPRVDDEYIRMATQRLRNKIGLSNKDPLTRKQLLELHHAFGSILVPVLWSGDKSGHENALSVYLPESKSSWVVFSLNAKDDDFNYWLAHELGHCFSIHALCGEDGEKFAERFAQELLFPHDAALSALDEITASKSPLIEAQRLADIYNISVVTVIRQIERTSLQLGKNFISLQTDDFWTRWKKGRSSVPTVSQVLFGSSNLSVLEYVENSEKFFKTPIFQAIAKWQQQEGGRSPAFIGSTLNIGIEVAFELSHLISSRYIF